MKRGQLQLSFGMIFSMIIIAVTLSIAGYMIFQFMKSGDTILCAKFKEKLQDSIDDAWRSDGASIDTRKEPLPSLPGGVDEVCFGNSTQPLLSAKDRANFDDLKEFTYPSRNLYISPHTSCKGEFSFTLKHITSRGFFCVPVTNNKIAVLISKDSTEPLVRLSPL